MAVECDTGVDKEGEMMKVEAYKCDRCGKDMGQKAWSYVHTHTDVYWSYPASAHLCKECTGDFNKWLKKKKEEKE